MATLTLDQISKVYRPKGAEPVVAVKDVSMHIQDGEIIGLLGSSGCGKTSTLRMIAGFESVTEGEIRVGEERINHLPPARRGIAMAFEGYALYPPLKVSDNIGFSLLRDKFPRAEVRKKVQEVASLLDIENILTRYPPMISGGQQQRVSLARALIRPADVHLLDEPMSQLEPQLRALLRARIKDYLIEQRMTTVFVTHDQTEAVALADRIAVMENGVLQQLGSPEDLKERPANLFVASFIGEPPMNLFPARVQGSGNEVCVQVLQEGEQSPAFSISLSEANGLQVGQDVWLGLRPHRLRIGKVEGTEAVAGQVFSNQWLGDQSHIGVMVGERPLTIVTDRGVDVQLEEKVMVSFLPESIHIFDRESEMALIHGAKAVEGVH